MDPQVTLYNLLDAIERNDRQEVDEYLNILLEWNVKGGFLPRVHPGQIDDCYVVWRNENTTSKEL